MPRHSIKSAVFGIPLHRTPFEDSDAAALVAALGSGALTGDGPATRMLAAEARASANLNAASPTGAPTAPAGAPTPIISA